VPFQPVGIGDEQRGQRGLPALGNGAFDQPARLVAGDGRAGPLEQAARDLDRAAREQWGRVPAPSQAGQGLRAASGLLLAARFVQSPEASLLLALLAQVAALADSVTRMREAQGRAVQAAAARRAGEALQAAYTARSGIAQLAQAAAAVAVPGRHRAAGTAWPLLQAAGAGAALVTLPAGTDPCDAGPDVLCAALCAASPLEDLVVDEVLAAWPDRRRFAEHQVHALRAAAEATATLPPDRIGRQVCRVAAALRLPLADVTREVADAASQSTTIWGAGAHAAGDRWHQTESTLGPPAKESAQHADPPLA